MHLDLVKHLNLTPRLAIDETIDKTLSSLESPVFKSLRSLNIDLEQEDAVRLDRLLSPYSTPLCEVSASCSLSERSTRSPQ